MPAITVENPLACPASPGPILRATVAAARRRRVVPAHHTVEGAGFEVWRPFPGGLDLHETDPFLLLDQLGPVEYGPRRGSRARPGTRTAASRPSPTCSTARSRTTTRTAVVVVIAEGDTQWMTAGAGILHDEVPSERAFNAGGPAHGVQLWVNLPTRLKFTPPRYQAITGDTSCCCRPTTAARWCG